MRGSGTSRSMRCRAIWKVRRKEKTEANTKGEAGMATSVIDMQQSKSENLKLEIVRVIKASREQVFNAWTRPEMIRQWFRPVTFTMAEANVDARVGGAYRFAMEGAGEKEQNPVVTGRYTRVDPFDALAFTWTSCRNPEEQSLVTIELRDVEGGTE